MLDRSAGRSRGGSAGELLLAIRRKPSQPLRGQLEEQLREAVRNGRLAPGSALPSSRFLAQQLGVSRGTVVEAFGQLGAEGYLTSRPGGTTRVAPRPALAAGRAPEPIVAEFPVDFRPGQPDLDEFPRQAWLQSVRRVLGEAPSLRLGYLEGRGTPELRETLAAYLNRVRATMADSANTLVCSGFAQGLRLVAQVLAASGVRRIGLEDPSLAASQSIVRSAGLEVVGLPVDAAGVRVDLLGAAAIDALLVTPAHQYPTGAVLTSERRAALVAWAAQRGAFIVEDDYDAEFRYDREPIGAIQGLAPERVIYAGSASKVLAPGLRLGWLVAPSALVPALAAAKADADMGSSALDQLVFADFVARGELERHLRRTRPIYRRRRDTLLVALARHLPEFRAIGTSAGLHILVWLPANLSEAALVRSAAARGIAISGLEPGRIAPGRSGAIVFGYGSIHETAIEAGIRQLGAVVAELTSAAASA